MIDIAHRSLVPPHLILYTRAMITFDITPRDHFRRLDSLLRNSLPQAPRSYLKKLAKGAVTVNGAPASPARLLETGDRVVLKETERTREFLSGAALPIDILYEDDRIVIINKQPGLAMHRTAEEQETNLVDIASTALALDGGSLRPVNRLDKGTSGAVILGRSSRSAGMYGRQVKEKGLGKVYLAVVAGTPPEAGDIDLPLDEKESMTRFRTLASGGGVSLLGVFPVTGRTHQIRRHLQAIGFPVLGDRRYGGLFLPDYPGHLLHSFRTTFTEEDAAVDIVIHAPLPEPLLDFLTPRLETTAAELLAAVGQSC